MNGTCASDLVWLGDRGTWSFEAWGLDENTCSVSRDEELASEDRRNDNGATVLTQQGYDCRGRELLRDDVVEQYLHVFRASGQVHVLRRKRYRLSRTRATTRGVQMQ